MKTSQVLGEVKKLVAALEAEGERSSWLEVALGGLRTAAANLESHERRPRADGGEPPEERAER